MGRKGGHLQAKGERRMKGGKGYCKRGPAEREKEREMEEGEETKMGSVV